MKGDFIERLLKGIRRSQEALEPFRVNRRLAIKQLAGHNWSENGSPAQVPVNVISMFVQTVSRAIVPKSPQIMLSTMNREHKPTVKAMERWGNKETERMRIDQTFRRYAIDGIVSLGMLKVGLATPADSARFAWHLNAGKAFAECVSLDRLVFDPRATSWDEVGWIGHGYTAPLDAIKDRSIYNKNRNKLEPSRRKQYNATGDEKVSSLGLDQFDYEQDLEDQVDLFEIYIPRHRLVITLADTDSGVESLDENRVLREQQWIGPDTGPYHPLGFGLIPDNIMPKSPVQDIMDMHLFANESVRKLFDQTRRSKDITLVRGTDGEKIRDSNDGEILVVADPREAVPISLGGANQKVQLSADWSYQLAKQLAGNLDALAGLEAGAKTATQDKMLTDSASAGVADMQQQMLTACAKVFKSFCWFWFHDPDLVMMSEIPIGEQSITTPVAPEQRMAMNWEDLDIKVDPYSMQHSTPQQRGAALDQVMTQIVLPLAPMLERQGRAPDIGKYLELKAKYQDMPDLLDICPIGEPMGDMQEGGMQQQQMGGMPANTERRYVRENVSERTSRGDSQNMRNQLMGIDPGGDPRQGGDYA
jgi:hypothetical protein